MQGYFDVTMFGAKGDGVTDDTAAIQAAVNAAGKIGGTVFFPTGKYVSGEIKLSPGTVVKGETAYSYRTEFGSIITLREDSDSTCLFNMNEAYGSKLMSLCLVGRGQDYRTVHGAMVDYPEKYASQEDAVCIDNCRIGHFSGDGIRLERIWCFSVRHSQSFCNKGAGIRCRGWDGFIIDCWLTANNGGGFVATDENASNTLTGNRIEWNAGGGIIIKKGQHYNITGNYIDRSGNTGIRIEASKVIALTSNVIYRSGRPEWGNGDDLDSCHFRLEKCNGITFTGNSLNFGRDDGCGQFSPSYGMVIHGCTTSVISQNTLFEAALKDLLIAADNDPSCLILNNPGTLAIPPKPE